MKRQIFMGKMTFENFLLEISIYLLILNQDSNLLKTAQHLYQNLKRDKVKFVINLL